MLDYLFKHFVTFLHWCFGNLMWTLICFGFSKTFINPKSRFHYKKMMEQLQTFAYAVKILILIQVYGLLMKVGLIKPSTKDSKMFIVVAVMVILVAAVVIFTYRKKEEKKPVLV